MFRLRRWCVLVFTIVLAPAVKAEDKPASPWAVDRALSVTPQSAPAPALKYRLLPLSTELKEGNAAPIYLRLAHSQTDAEQKFWTETPGQWNAMPLDKVPLDEARKFLQEHHTRYLLRQLELGARRRTAEWNYTADAGDVEGGPIGLLLPDLQSMRKYTPMQILQARVALAQGDFTAAAHHLETGLAFSRHVADGPTLIHRLVGIALASQFRDTLVDFVERPDSPNLYWALTALPHPLIGLRSAEDWEYRMVELQIPELGDLDRERTPEQWDGVLRRVRTELQPIALLSSEGSKPKVPDWFPKNCAPEDPAAKSPDLAAARQFVARTRGLRAEQAEAMPPAQVLLLYTVGTFHEDRDDFYRAAYLPYHQCFPLMEAADKRLRETPPSEARVLSRIFLPALNKAISRQARLERTFAALRVIEALRIYAAAHDNKLPDKLNDVTEVPIPDDPGTGRPFDYSRDGDTATVVSQVPGDPEPNNGVRYRVTVRKK
ncbi:MAG TPA: hypothetical protein VGY58_15510 [Gemmataceae bacterium]|nr:hypothetical protein [Gemmataceae bacterium]